MEEIELDARGLDCPLPLLKAKQALSRLPPGAKLRVLATDPGSQRDFAAFCRVAGHQLLENVEQDGTYRYLLAKCAEPRS